MPLIRFPTPTGLVYTIDLSKISDRENPRTVEAPIAGETSGRPFTIDWGDGNTSDYPAGASTFPTHEYSEVGVYTVVIRSVDGHLPKIVFAGNSTVERNVIHALTALDHHGGESYNTSQAFSYVFRNAENCSYVDPRFPGQSGWSSFQHGFRQSGISQPLQSFCFDFATQATLLLANFIYCSRMDGYIEEGFFDNNILVENVASLFEGCLELSSRIPEGLFDKHKAIKNFASTFKNCPRLDGAPYVFWKVDGSLDTDKFPSLTNGANCYANCSADMRAQVPTYYGGTLSVS